MASTMELQQKLAQAQAHCSAMQAQSKKLRADNERLREKVETERAEIDSRRHVTMEKDRIMKHELAEFRAKQQRAFPQQVEVNNQLHAIEEAAKRAVAARKDLRKADDPAFQASLARAVEQANAFCSVASRPLPAGTSRKPEAPNVIPADNISINPRRRVLTSVMDAQDVQRRTYLHHGALGDTFKRCQLADGLPEVCAVPGKVAVLPERVGVDKDRDMSARAERVEARVLIVDAAPQADGVDQPHPQHALSFIVQQSKAVRNEVVCLGGAHDAADGDAASDASLQQTIRRTVPQLPADAKLVRFVDMIYDDANAGDEPRDVAHVYYLADLSACATPAEFKTAAILETTTQEVSRPTETEEEQEVEEEYEEDGEKKTRKVTKTVKKLVMVKGTVETTKEHDTWAVTPLSWAAAEPGGPYSNQMRMLSTAEFRAVTSLLYEKMLTRAGAEVADLLEDTLLKRPRDQIDGEAADHVKDAAAQGLQPGTLKRRRVDVIDVDLAALRTFQQLDPALKEGENKMRTQHVRTSLLALGKPELTLRRVNKMLETYDEHNAPDAVHYAALATTVTSKTTTEIADSTPFCTAVFPPSL
eukprot:TRINITY_DN33110_c0_g1_i1.p1 TRINITY_DN33110_c0_g1~~TRINITY_DN33110_c0_g1_i1.p1  ORF type:complete len:589 (+),score=215.12 TRINITY_DN33110_c0_g1_i1:42-1808(+)